MTYKRYKDHWVVLTESGEVYCHCDSVQECREEIQTIKTHEENGRVYANERH